MRRELINFLKTNPHFLTLVWGAAHFWCNIACIFTKIRQNTILIASFGGRKYDDSPRAIYEEILKRPEFTDWEITWAFIDPDKFNIPRGNKIKIDTLPFFKALLTSKVLISNSGIDRNIRINRKGSVKVETWHGTPLKKILSDQNSGNLGNAKPPKYTDKRTIRCAQSAFDRRIFMRVFNASKRSFLTCGLPRNDVLRNASDEMVKKAKERVGIPKDKKAILYMPTYREYLVNEKNETFIAPPVDFSKWEAELGDEYVLCFRAHYAVSAALDLKETGFLKDVSDYPEINDLYLAADILISDYSSAFVDYAITGKPMFCFAYDYEEYQEKRGLYIDLEEELPCTVDRTENEILSHIKEMNYEKYREQTKAFAKKYAPVDGNAAKAVVDEILRRI